jgi:hypothetical protein
MSEAVTPLQQYKNQVILAVFGVNLVFGGLIAAYFPNLIELKTLQEMMVAFEDASFRLALQGYKLVLLVLCFIWLGLDSKQLDIRRPWWLNIGIALMSEVFVSYYLFKTRPQGRRLSSILRFLGIVFGGAFVAALGSMIATAVYGMPASGPPAL